MIPIVIRRRSGPKPWDIQSRSLRLVVDFPLHQSDPAVKLLLRFTGHEAVEVWSTAPDATYRVTLGECRGDVEEPFYEFHAPSGSGKGRIDDAPLMRNCAIRLVARRIAPESGLEPALIRAAMAHAFGADAFVADEPLRSLREHGLPDLQRYNLLTPDEALALVGLKLRTGREFDVPFGQGARFGVDRGSYYWHAARMCLTATSSWHSKPLEQGEWHAAVFTQGALVRISNALRARDHCHVEYQLRHEPDSDEAVYHLDMYLVSMMGAFDAAARVASKRLNLTLPGWQIGWRRRAWLNALRAKAPALVNLVADGTRGHALLEVLGLLRNLVHGETLGSRVIVDGAEHLHALFIPDGIERHFLDQFASLGEAEAWGVMPGRWPNERSAFFVPRFLEVLTPALLTFLDQLMLETVFAVSGSRELRSPLGRSGGVYVPELEDTFVRLLGIEPGVEEGASPNSSKGEL